jgi:hypothetical protein
MKLINIGDSVGRQGQSFDITPPPPPFLAGQYVQLIQLTALK